MKRKHILPAWVRFFSWLYLPFILSPLILLALSFVDGEMTFGVFGLKYRDSSIWHPIPLLVTSIFTYAGIVAYGMLWGKDWAINAGIVYGIIGIGMSIATTINSFASRQVHISIEPFMLIAFVVALSRRRNQWNNYKSENSTEEKSVEHAPPVQASPH